MQQEKKNEERKYGKKELNGGKFIIEPQRRG